ncbi:MAG: GH92 family glycosyl hydrolase [Bacteroidota bacterium]
MNKALQLAGIILVVLGLTSCAHVDQVQERVNYVDPNIGGVGHVLQPTVPIVHIPHSMVRLAPLRTPDVLDKYLAPKIYEFPLTITSHRIADAFAIMPTSGALSVNKEAVASEYDHSQETATPYYYSVLLEDSDILEEHTVTEHAAYFRFQFTRPDAGHVLLRSHKNSMLEVVDASTVRGYEDDEHVRYFFHAVFNKPSNSHSAAVGKIISDGLSRVEGKNTCVSLDYAGPRPRTIEVKVGISYISLEQAARNVEKEMVGWNFDGVKQRARGIWEETLGKVKVEGGTEKQRRIFYTAIYRAHERMVSISEDGKYFSSFDGKVHDDGGHPFYVDDWLWDTYRSLHSLQLLLDPARKADMVSSYVRMFEQEGWVPSFPIVRGDHACMIGNHAASMVADMYLKGLRDFDVEKAYEGLRKNALQATMLPWANGPATELDSIYYTKGFFPALAPGEKEWVKETHSFERRQSVAVTLEHCYDDWCLAQLAKALNKQDDYDYFMKRASNYLNVYNRETGFMSPKTADGNWIQPFDPKLSGGQGGRAYFAECNSWTYTWSVQHDIQGLINLMGGREKFIARLNQMFNEGLNTEKFFFVGQFPDATGLNGQFAMGDEPSFHIPYLYNYAGAPWRTQKCLRQLMDVWFDDDPLGICGDEDGGALSSWYVFNAMGFYPVTPGSPVYNIGSPIFAKVTLSLGNGKEFVLRAKDVSAVNKYIQAATLNGQPLDKPWFQHSEIANGGTLELQMGPRPNKAWGSQPGDAPPSMSKPVPQQTAKLESK